MFDNHFEVFLADTKESKKIHYSIRYQVFCEEMGFENKDDFPLQMECDENDDKAVHFIVRDKFSGDWVCAMRLIPKQDTLLPIEMHCKINEKIEANDLFGAVELSRLCLVKDVRRGFNDIDPPHGISDDSEQPKETNKIKLMSARLKTKRMIIWGLIYAASVYCYKNKIHNWYFMTTSALVKVLRRGGLNLINIGESCQHNGERFPFKMDVVETFKNQIWQKGYKKGYKLFSELSDAQQFPAFAVA